MSVTCNAHLFTDTGQMTCLDATAGMVGAVTVSGWAHKVTGEPYVEQLGAGAVPGTAVRIDGTSYGTDGRRYVTTEAVAAADSYMGSLRVRTDGALRVSTGAVGATDVYSGCWAVAQTGEARVSIT